MVILSSITLWDKNTISMVKFSQFFYKEINAKILEKYLFQKIKNRILEDIQIT